jgi:hypothetical protein
MSLLGGEKCRDSRGNVKFIISGENADSGSRQGGKLKTPSGSLTISHSTEFGLSLLNVVFT